jgi:hypothetical protein
MGLRALWARLDCLVYYQRLARQPNFLCLLPEDFFWRKDTKGFQLTPMEKRKRDENLSLVLTRKTCFLMTN